MDKQITLSAKAAASSKKGNIISLDNGYGDIQPPEKGSVASKAVPVKRTKG